MPRSCRRPFRGTVITRRAPGNCCITSLMPRLGTTISPRPNPKNPFPRTLYPEKRPVSLPRGGPWQYVETDWAALDATDEEYGGDYLVTAMDFRTTAKPHQKPFFLACGIYRPHEPWFVPKKYFEPFPLESIQLPPGYREDDLKDLPPEGKRRGPNRYFAHIQKHGQWKQAIQGYLASIYFADTMLGRVLDALEKSPHAKNTIVVLWSDHGWHLGEKQHWQKYTAWRLCTRVPLMIRVPQGAPGLPKGTQPGRCATARQSAQFVSYAVGTLRTSRGIASRWPQPRAAAQNPEQNWPHASITYLGDPGSYGLSTDRWRLIHYANGDEELYDISTDPYEWTNLATKPVQAAKLKELRSLAPERFAVKRPPSIDALSSLIWKPATDKPTPASQPDGNPFDVVFLNQSPKTVKLHWMDLQGQPKFYAEIAAGKNQRQQTRPGTVWLITDTSDQPLGHFRVGDRTAKAIVPRKESSE